jgi:hypothetical protein
MAAAARCLGSVNAPRPTSGDADARSAVYLGRCDAAHADQSPGNDQARCGVLSDVGLVSDPAIDRPPAGTAAASPGWGFLHPRSQRHSSRRQWPSDRCTLLTQRLCFAWVVSVLHVLAVRYPVPGERGRERSRWAPTGFPGTATAATCRARTPATGHGTPGRLCLRERCRASGAGWFLSSLHGSTASVLGDIWAIQGHRHHG